MHFDLKSYLLILIGLFNFGLSCLILLKGKQAKDKILFWLTSFAVTLWVVSMIFYRSVVDMDLALRACRTLYASASLIPAFFLYFAVVFHELPPRMNALLVGISVIAAVFFVLVSAYTDSIVKSVQIPLEGEKIIRFGSMYPVYFAYIVSYFAAGIFVLVVKLRQATGFVREQIRTILLGVVVASNFGVFCNLILPTLGIFTLNWLGQVLTLFFVIFVGIAVFRYKFLDTEVVIRKTLVFAGLFTFAFGTFALVSFLAQDLLSTYVIWGRRVYFMVAVLMVVLGYDPIRRFLTNVTDRYLFQKKYDYQKVLKDASRGMSRIESLNYLLKLVIHFVTMRIRIKNAAAMMWNEFKKTYEIVYWRGYGDVGGKRRTDVGRSIHSATVSPDHALVRYLLDVNEVLDIDRLRGWMDSGAEAGKRDGKESSYDWKAIESFMKDLRASCIVPSFLGKELRSMLILGAKKSGDIYTDQDLTVLHTLAQESAIAIENARLYDEAVHKSKELERINRQLEQASSRLILALNAAEEANKRLLDTQAQLIHEQRMATLGRLAASVGHEVNNPLTILSMNVSRMILKYRKDPELKVRAVEEYFQKMESNIQRIKAVVNTLTGLLKKSERGRFEALSLKLVIEETLPLVQFQTYLDNLTGTEVEFDIPAQIPLIKGDLERLQEVFLNLFTNAYHALADSKERRIRVLAHVDPANPKFVTVDFSDSGCGMEEETASKIFNYGFTTKGEGRGSGIGLYMCRYIIEIHGGEVKVRSKRGEGTTFTMTLPIYEEEISRLAR